MRRRVARITLSLVLLAALGAALFFWWRHDFYGPGPLEDPVSVMLEPGSGLRAIAKRLEAEGVIKGALFFAAGVSLLGHSRDLRAGEYLFDPKMSGYEVMDKLFRGEVVIRRVTLPEGLTSAEIARLIAAAEGLIGELPSELPEGRFLPETYHYSRGDTRAAIVERMRRAMTETLDELWPARAEDLPFASPEAALILASIVEKETGLPEERARVAAVFVNRLRRSMPLQSDPTVVYALTGGAGPLGRPLTRDDLEVDSPYNTYRVPGLPPGPIANPGREAIAAVLHPAETNELYFVATGDGGHAFAQTLEEHNRNVRRLRERQAGD